MARELRILLVLVLLSGIASPAAAQQARQEAIAIDSSIAFDGAIDERGSSTPGLVADTVVTTRIAQGLDAIVRPWIYRPGSSGRWNAQVWLATLRYERRGHVGLRVDGGLIPSPVGYGNLLLRAPLNPTTTLPASLMRPLPAAAPGQPRATLLGIMYPYGVSATVSSSHWDARAALIDTSPMRMRRVFSRSNPPRFANAVVGGGVTPATGLRIGASITHGGWWSGSERTPDAGMAAAPAPDLDATLVTVESEYEVRHTKIVGEWVRNHFELPGGRAEAASGWFVQGEQTLTPRWFAAGRVERMSSPALVAAGTALQHLTGVETTVGYRLNRAVTLRAGHIAQQQFGRGELSHSATMSVVWWRRWK